MSDQIINLIGAALLCMFLVVFVIPPYFRWEIKRQQDKADRE